MVLDLRIPGLSANDIVAFIRTASGMDRVKVVLVATEGTDPGINAPLPTGADSYINQPFSNEELVNKVNQLLEPSYV